MSRPPEHTAIALTIAGSDSGGGAGIQADLKAFAALGVHGLSAISALTAQSTTEVRGVFDVPPEFLALQLATLRDDFRIDAVKTGMLARPDTIEVVASFLAETKPPLIVDPVMIAASGARLISPGAADVMAKRLFPLALLVTPNLPEVEALTGALPTNEAEMITAAERIRALGARAVLIKGGHLAGDPIDVLLDEAGQRHSLAGPRIQTHAGHGTGCTYASAITAYVARGRPLVEAVKRAHAFVRGALQYAPVGVGHGPGPLHPLFQLEPRDGNG